MSQTKQEKQEEAIRKGQLAIELSQNVAFRELIEEPHARTAATLLEKACEMAMKPANERNDAHVVEVLRNFILTRDFGTYIKRKADNYVKQVEKTEALASK